LGSRGVFGQAIFSISELYPNLMVLSADLGKSSGLDRFAKTYPEKFLNMGIAEQNLIGVAAGLSKEGFQVFATSFAPFISMRASEQIRMNMGYMGLNIKAVSIGSGLSMGFLGNSHYGIEDAAIMRAIPNITVVSPADCGEIIKVVYASLSYDKPMYIRLTGGVNNPVVYENEYDFQIGKAVTLKEGNDIFLIASGTMVHEALEAAKYLDALNISVSVINMHTLKPLDTELLDKVLSKGKPIVTIEEHSIIGGLGSAVSEYKTRFKNAPPHLIIGLPDAFGDTGDYEYLLNKYHLKGNLISERIKSFIAEI
jgi:transketolase